VFRSKIPQLGQGCGGLAGVDGFGAEADDGRYNNVDVPTHPQITADGRILCLVYGRLWEFKRQLAPDGTPSWHKIQLGGGRGRVEVGCPATRLYLFPSNCYGSALLPGGGLLLGYVQGILFIGPEEEEAGLPWQAPRDFAEEATYDPVQAAAARALIRSARPRPPRPLRTPITRSSGIGARSRARSASPWAAARR